MDAYYVICHCRCRRIGVCHEHFTTKNENSECIDRSENQLKLSHQKQTPFK